MNSAINLFNPNNTPDVEDGKPSIYHAADAQATRIDEKQLNPAQLMDISVIHELEHYNGTADPDNASVEKELWHDWLKY